MGSEGLFYYCWILSPILGGFYARTNSARVATPKIVSWFYIYCLGYVVLWIPVLSVIVIRLINGLDKEDTNFFDLTLLCLSIGFALYWWAFETYLAHKPDYVPVGIRVWAGLSRQALSADKGGFIDTESLGKRISDTRDSVVGTVQAKVETHRAKVDAYELALAKEHEDAQADLARATRDFNEAKIRAEEAAKRKNANGR